jgi:L-iditol 2-dehydrogenase
MNLTGRAVVADGQDFTVQESTVPDPVPHGIVLKQELGGICGTDLHKWQQFLPGPTLLGHESVGTVVALGQEMQKDFQGQPLKEGDRVVYHPRNSGTAYGYRGLEFPFSGGFADYISLSDPETCVLKTETDARTAVLAEPFAIGTHAVMRAEVQLGDSVIVQGSGAIGLMVLICARLSGASQIIVIGGPARRLELAQRLGAHVTVDIAEFPDTVSRKEVVLAHTRQGGGADVVFECAGFLPAVPEGLEYVKQDGKFIECGHFIDVGDIPVNPARHFLLPNMRLEGIWGSRFPHFVRGLSLLEQLEWPIGEMVSHILPLERVRDGFEALNQTYQLDGADVIKIALASDDSATF